MQKRKTAIGIVLVTMLLSAFLLIRPIAAEETGYQNISVQKAHKMIKNHPEGVFILDVRNQSEYDLGHLYNAFLIPVYQLENISSSILPQPPENDTLMWSMYEESKSHQLQLHINDTVIVYCAAGSRSALACQILAEHGFTKVYNMLGGITAWMQANYPIYTTYHHATVDLKKHGQQLQIEIEPWLLYQSNCTSCQNQTLCPDDVQLSNTTETVLEETENQTILLVTGEVNGTTVTYMVNKTRLWHYNELESGLNRTITFVSNVITMEGNSTTLLSLTDYIQHADYNLTIGTFLFPLDSETYNRSITMIQYVPAGRKGITTAERVDFEKPVMLSQLFDGLSKTISKIGKEYGRSQDTNLTVVAERYNTMAEETKLLSRLIRTQIPEYNRKILNSSATVMDVTMCDVCGILCGIVVLVGCFVACYFSYTAACFFCITYMQDIYKYGCSILCYTICNWPPTPSPVWIGSVIFVGGYGTWVVENEGDICGPLADGDSVHLHAPNWGDTVQIVTTLNYAVYSGNLFIYGCSGSGGYLSDLYVWVSIDYYTWYGGFIGTITNTEPASYYIGYFDTPFYYIAIAGYDGGCSICLYLDAVSVVP